MKVALVTAFDEAYLPLARISLPIMRDYCTKHGYSLVQGAYKTENVDVLEYGDRGKIKIYKDLYAQYDLVCWMDIDLLIMNSEIRLENLITLPYETLPFLWTYDVAGPCSGFWVAQTVPPVYLMLEKVQQKAAETSNLIVRENYNPHSVTIGVEPRGTSDQTTMRSLMSIPPYSHVLRHCVSGKSVGHCYLYADYGWEQYNDLGNYEEGDFMLTFPSLPLEQRLAKMTEWARFAK